VFKTTGKIVDDEAICFMSGLRRFNLHCNSPGAARYALGPGFIMFSASQIKTRCRLIQALKVWQNSNPKYFVS
jgi:hypothetical protein